MTPFLASRPMQSALIVVIVSFGTFVPLASAKCVIKPTRNPDAVKVKPCKQIADYTPPNSGHPDGTHGSGSRYNFKPSILSLISTHRITKL